MVLLAVDLVMIADVEQDDLFFGNHDGDAIAVGEAYRFDMN
jgi:hypothetical protein